MNHKEIERWYRLRLLKKSAMGLVILLVVVGASALGFRLLYKHGPAQNPVPEEAGSGMEIDNFSYSHPGAHPFDVKAVRAKIATSMDKAILEKPEIVYYPKDGGRLVLTAKTGELDRSTGNYSAQGDVKISYDGSEIKADTFRYSHDDLMIETPDRFTIKSKEFDVSGEGLKLWPQRREVKIAKNVKATFSNINIIGSDKKEKPNRRTALEVSRGEPTGLSSTTRKIPR